VQRLDDLGDAPGDAGHSIISLGEMAEDMGRIARSMAVPVMGDGDTGFGNAVNAYVTLQEFEREGRRRDQHRGPGDAETLRRALG
jgi:hypothetical protein